MNDDGDQTSVLAQFRLEVHPGADLVARLPNALLLLRTPALSERELAARLLELCSHPASQLPQDGRRLMRQVAGMLAAVEREDAPTFALLVPVGRQVAVLLHGDVHIVVRGAAERRLSGAESATWVDRILAADFDAMDARIRGGSVPPSSLDLDLRAGIVPGEGWTLVRHGTELAGHGTGLAAHGTEAQTAGPAVAEQDAGGTAQGGPRPLVPVSSVAPDEERTKPPSEPVTASTFESVPLMGDVPTDGKRQPLPILPHDDTDWAPEPQVPQIRGILCANGHFNDPAALYCRIDGVSLAQRTHDYVTRTRPPLGVVVFDDGSSYSVDGDYVLGREPQHDEKVQAGLVRSLMVTDDEDAISRVHAEIRIDGWTPTILDRGSVNGTYIASPGAVVWNPLTPQQPVPLLPGTRVQIGARTFVYDSYLKI